MTSDQHPAKVASAEAPAIRSVESHTSEDHYAAPPKATHGNAATVAAPFKEATSLVAPALGAAVDKA